MTWAVSLCLGAMWLLSLLFTLLFSAPPALACEPHQVAEYQGQTVRCVSKCNVGEVFVSIAPDGNRHCFPQENMIYTWLLYFIRFLSNGVGIAVVGGIVWGGILYATGRDNAAQLQKSRTIIVNSLMGLLLYLLMFAILNFLIPGGVLT